MSIFENSIGKILKELFIPLYLTSFLIAIVQSSVLMIIPLYAIKLGANPGIAALLFSLLGIGRFFSNIPVSYLIARIGYKFSMIAGFGVSALTGIFGSSLTSFVELGLLSFFFGVTATIFLLSRLTLITVSIESFQRGKIIASMAGINRGGNILGPITSGYITVKFGFSYVFVTIAIISLLSALLILLSKIKNKKPEKESALSLIEMSPKIIKKNIKIFSTVGIAMFLLTFIRNCKDFLMPIWGNYIGLDTSEIGLIIGYSAAIEMIMSPVAGFALDNFGRKFVALSCISLLTIGIFLITFTSDFYSLLFVIILIGIGNGLGGGVNLTIGSDLASKVRQIEFLGVWRMLSDSGAFIGPILIGYVAKTFYLSTALFFTSSIGIINILLIIFFVEETLVKKNK